MPVRGGLYARWEWMLVLSDKNEPITCYCHVYLIKCAELGPTPRSHDRRTETCASHFLCKTGVGLSYDLGFLLIFLFSSLGRHTQGGMLCATRPRVNSHHQPIINYASFLSCARSNSIKSCERSDPFPLFPSCCTTQSGPKSGFWRCDSACTKQASKRNKLISKQKITSEMSWRLERC